MVVAGWYGKIASLGDFASRRLAPEFVARWDAWLQQVIAASRERLGDAWLDAYLTSPVWRFIEWPPAEGAPLHAGLVMPSVDRVGRYFPLCVAAPLPASPALDYEWQELVEWCDRVEAAALATLDTGHSAESFEEALAALPAPSPRHGSDRETAALLEGLRGGGPCAVGGVRHADIGATLTRTAALSLARAAAGASLWWAGGAGDSCLIGCPRLPDAERYIAMLRPDRAPPAEGGPI